jgi:hypothetical protein
MSDDWRQRCPVRTGDQEIEEAADGFIVYQPREDRIHYLNHTAALVLEMCDGRHSGEEMAAWLARAYSLGRPPLADVAEALASLAKEGLIAWAPAGDEAGGKAAETA